MRTIALVLMLSAGVCAAQDRTIVDLHIDHEAKATQYARTIPWVIGFGTLFTYVASQPEHLDDDTALAFGFGVAMVSMSTALTIGYGEQKRKAKRERLVHLQ